MQALYHATIELDGAARGVFGLLERRDDLASQRDFLRRRREDDVASLDVARMDQRLAVEAEIARLRAFGGKAINIGNVAVRAVEDLQPMRAGGDDAMGDHRDHFGAARLHAGARLPRNVVRAAYKTGEPHLGIA